MSDPNALTPFESRLLDDLQSFRRSLREPVAASAGPGRRWRLGLAIGIAAAVGLAAAGAVVLRGTSHSKAATVAPPRAADVKRRVLLALSGSDDRILHETTITVGQILPGVPSSDQRQEQWSDLSTGRSRDVIYGPGNEPMTESTSSFSGDLWHLDVIIYGARVWRTTKHSFPGTSGHHGGPEALADGIREQVSSGAFTLVGPDTIAGRSVLHLRRLEPALPVPANAPAAMQSLPRMTLDMWVDASSYLPVRQELSTAANVVSRSMYEWLPRTAATIAELNLVVPSGFTHTTGNTGTTVGDSWTSTSYSVTLTPAKPTGIPGKP